MNQINNISQLNESNIKDNETNRFQTCEEVVDILVEKGIPSTFSPIDFITKISKSFDISYQEAKTCLKFAMREIEAKNKKDEVEKEDSYQQSGYFYPQNSYTVKNKDTKDGMDSLSSLGNYNRLMLNIR